MKRLSVFTCLLYVLVSCKTVAPVAVTPYEVIPISAKSDSVINSNGVFYALPRQRLDVDMVIKKQEFVKGPYAEFTEKLLGVKTGIKHNYSIYTIENVSVSQQSEVDLNRIYFVQFNDSELALEYGKGLLINGVNTSKRKTSEQNKNDFHKHADIPNTKNTHRFPIIYTDNFIERTDTVISKQLVDTQMIPRYEIRTVKTEKTPQQKAEEFVEIIAKIREDRNKLLTGYQEVSYEAAAIKYMADEFNRLEDEYIRLFTGSTKVSYETVHFEFLPENKDSLTVELALFSTNSGLSNVSGDKKIILNMVLNEEVTNSVAKFSEHINLPKNGFFYSVPCQALVKISLDNQILLSKPMKFSQLGLTQSLAPDLLQIEFLPKTGEIKRVKAMDNKREE